jgi:hypothetical protein
VDAVADNIHTGENFRLPASTFIYHGVAFDVNLISLASLEGYETPESRSLFKRFYIFRVATISGSLKITDKRVTELLISNYKASEGLRKKR